DYEQAILTAIQMYALHQQSNEKSVLKIEYNEGEKRQNLGDALSTLRGSDNKSIDRRFNAMILSSNYLQLQNHLRQFIKLLKAKSDAKVDYASVADDLFWFLKNQKDGVKIKWSRSYYKFRKVNDKGEN
ncbi:MAG: type I-E CRISPR-associated protein Cse2/CasB, partial [Lactobacillus iners]|nr:type I-E CRISPR-associated protein Cse2/CasB [Lactobacillus iners]